MHDLLCWTRWATALGEEAPRSAKERLLTEASAMVAQDRRQWAEYGAKPLYLAPAPDSLLFPAVSALTSANLDWEILRQATDGSWRPNWSWGQYPEAWARAEVAWAGRIPVDTLRSLRAYGRLPLTGTVGRCVGRSPPAATRAAARARRRGRDGGAERWQPRRASLGATPERWRSHQAASWRGLPGRRGRDTPASGHANPDPPRHLTCVLQRTRVGGPPHPSASEPAYPPLSSCGRTRNRPRVSSRLASRLA